ncbi:hypothetical protein [Peromfec virus RodF8_37]|uniref:Uncharacterized protein n=1 Tax=Peromfec virus RodF8_37 TaxID=2929372 RepID=A0A976N334_9VIRU|nr:hypothetical protein [Peromfec virus RodF8_37]
MSKIIANTHDCKHYEYECEIFHEDFSRCLGDLHKRVVNDLTFDNSFVFYFIYYEDSDNHNKHSLLGYYYCSAFFGVVEASTKFAFTFASFKYREHKGLGV